MLSTLLQKSEFLASPIKYILIYLFTLIGLSIDVEPLRLYIWLWMIDAASYFVKSLILKYDDKVIRSIRYSAAHLGIILIPIAMVVLMDILGKETEWAYHHTLSFFSGFVFLNLAGNIISLKTKKEYNFDSKLDVWIKKISKSHGTKNS
jgi:hypothetical protein